MRAIFSNTPIVPCNKGCIIMSCNLRNALPNWRSRRYWFTWVKTSRTSITLPNWSATSLPSGPYRLKLRAAFMNPAAVLKIKESFRPMALKTERRQRRFSIKQKPQKRLNKADL